jgi:HK97 family phage portal protein
MNFFYRLTSWFGSSATNQSSGVQDSRPISSAFKNAPAVTIDTALQVSSVWSSIELLSDNIASLPIFVYKEIGKGVRDLARDSSLWKLLHEKPNSRHTPYEFWVFMVMNYLFRGNAYARLERNGKGEVYAMWPLASDQVEVTVLSDGSLAYGYSINGQVIVYNEASILHFRDKGNGIVGLSRLDYMKSSVGVAINAQESTSKIFSNDNKRPMMVTYDKFFTSDQRAQFRAQFKGLTESGDDNLLILEGGMKGEPLSMTPADVQLLDTRKFSVEDIARWFGVPSILINDSSNRVPYGNNDDLVEFFYKFRLRPMLVGFEQRLKHSVMTIDQRQKMTIEFSLDALLRSSLEKRVEIMAKQVQNGLKTRNEARQYENDPPMDGGDVLTAQTNLAPLDMLGKIKGVGNAASQDTIAQ